MRAGIGPYWLPLSSKPHWLPRASGDRPYGVKIADMQDEVAPCERG